MSTTVRIKTRQKKLDIERVFLLLANDGYKLIAKFIKNDICEFYQHKLSTRPINISKEDDGYEVRITTLACREDYELFAKVALVVEQETAGKVFCEDDDEQITDVLQYFNAKWIDRQMKSDFSIATTLILGKYVDDSEPDKKHEVGLYGPICMFYLGEDLFNNLGITLNTNWNVGSNKLIERFRYSQYSRPHDIRRTTTSMVIKINNMPEDDENKKYITVYSQNAYDMISRTDYFALNGGKEKVLLLDYNNFMNIVPEQWERFDNCQYFTSPLSDKQFKEFWDRAKKYSIDPPEDLDIDYKSEESFGTLMARAWFYADVNYVREHTSLEDLPPCVKEEECDAGYTMPPIFYAIAKCQEIIFDSDSYAEEYMPVVLEMRNRSKAMVEFWEKERNISKLKSIPFNLFSDMFYIPDDDATIEDVTEYSPNEFRAAGFSNSNLILYISSLKFDFKKVKELLKTGVDPDIEMYPKSNDEHIICTSQEMLDEGYAAFQYIYAKYRWFIDTGEMVMNYSDFSRLFSCAAHKQMYELLKEERKKYLKTH